MMIFARLGQVEETHPTMVMGTVSLDVILVFGLGQEN
jgi:hypothetical protein